MVLSWFGKKAAADQPKALPDNREKSAGSNDDVPKPRSAKYGVVCETRTFIDADAADLGMIKMRAYQIGKGNWAVKTIKITNNTQAVDADIDDQIWTQKTEAQGLSFWDAIVRLAEFESAALTPESGRTPVGYSAEELGYKHYKAFAEREGTVAFDVLGQPHVAVDGVVISDGAFLEKDLQRVIAAHDLGDARQQQAPGWPDGLLAEMFSDIAAAADFEMIAYNLQMRGYAEEFVTALEDAKKVLGHFDSYFDAASRQQSVDEWYRVARGEYYRSILPQKLAGAGLSLNNVFKSRAFQDALADNPEEYAPFAKALQKSSDKKIATIEKQFFNSVKQAWAAIEAIDAAMDGQEPALKDKTVENLNNVVATLVFTYQMFRAKAQFAFIQHVKGDVSDHLHELEDYIVKAEQIYERLGAPEEQLANVRKAVLSGSDIQIPAMIDEFITNCKEQSDRYAQAAASGGTQQLALDLIGGENGLTKHKLGVDVDLLIEKVKDEKGAEYAARFEKQITDSLAVMQKRFSPARWPS